MRDAMTGEARTPWKRLLLEDIAYGRADRIDFLRGLAALGLALGAAILIFRGLFLFAEGFSDDGAVRGLALVVQLVGYTIAGALAVIGAVLVAAVANLIAKRLRDIGLPGWHSLAIAWVLGAAFSLGAPMAAAISYIVVVWLVLFLMPTMRPRRRL